MREKNNGIGEDNVLQNQFTAYLVTATRNRKIRYLQKNDRRRAFEVSIEMQIQVAELSKDDEPLTGLPVIEQLESHLLQKALRQAKERDLYILFARALHNKTFDDIAGDLGLKLNTVASIYYRLIERLRIELRGSDK